MAAKKPAVQAFARAVAMRRLALRGDVADHWAALLSSARGLGRAQTHAHAVAKLLDIAKIAEWLRTHGAATVALTQIGQAAGMLWTTAREAEGMSWVWPSPAVWRQIKNFAANVERYATASPNVVRHNPGKPAKKAGPSTRARVAYRVTHWGHGGKKGGRVLEFAEPAGDIAEIGELMAVVYRTTKAGDPPRSTYVHEFGPRARPRLCFNVESKRLLIGGGAARMRTRGITG